MTNGCVRRTKTIQCSHISVWHICVLKDVLGGLYIQLTMKLEYHGDWATEYPLN